MKKLLSILGILAVLFIASSSSADWVDDLKPLPAGVNNISVKFQPNGKDGIVTLKTKSGKCTTYKVVNNKVVQLRKCADPDWTTFINHTK